MAVKQVIQAAITNNASKSVKQTIKANNPVKANALSRFDSKILGGRGAEKVAKIQASDNGLMKSLIPGKGEISKTVKHSVNADDIAGLRSDISKSVSQNRTNMANTRKQMLGLAEGSDEAIALQKQIDNYKTANKSLISSGNEIKSGSYTSDASMWDKGKQYFGNEEYGGNRKIAAGVGVGAAMIGTRFATGGSLTRNGNGESDIVGIPFI